MRYAGRGVYGPWHGKSWVAEAPYYRVADMTELRPRWDADEPDVIPSPNINIITYQHVKSQFGDLWVAR